MSHDTLSNICISLYFVVQLKKLAPKPPVTAYFLFVNAKRGRYKDKHPDLKASEISKNLADKWHALSSERQVNLCTVCVYSMCV